ncbi:oxygenase MpaB family protein [Sandaracinus amylolyticus]|uniref:ER-bound oxygenase mpaB/mpaB'/Rubber oxygenase catalytic domain-containing protein n=1 Tax=Sandaracinus amylolyticus TaxID=927083 RepID=A0A0F6YGQ7_9BACT|nr:oxygenase MpaB family protein [Sandaracinus amylolyticus]AKF03128.1 hypothetical protein DB32_000277 [Sandaracinus amylolyticus]
MRRPTEFRYWENLDRRIPRFVRTLGQRVLGFDPAPSDDVVRTFASMYYDADPLAEAYVDEVYLRRGTAIGREMLERALAHGVASVEGAPASLVRLLDDVERDPEWLDWDLVEQGARVFRRWSTDVFRFAGAITLAAYSESSVAKPLALTGAYAGASTKHRFLETAAFWIAVSEPGGLRPGAGGRLSAMRVRMMHVFVRQRLLAHPEWDLDAWGVPISQADAMLTLMGGSFGPGLAMHAMGYRTSAREIEATMHFWRYVGHLMGVRPRWYPSSMREAAQLSFVTFVKSAGRAGEDGKMLCRSYASAFAPEREGSFFARMHGELEHRVHLGYTRFFLPPPIYRANGLPPAGVFALAPLALAPFVLALETARRNVPGADAISDRIARARRERWLARHLAGRATEYRPVESFTR